MYVQVDVKDQSQPWLSYALVCLFGEKKSCRHGLSLTQCVSEDGFKLNMLPLHCYLVSELQEFVSTSSLSVSVSVSDSLSLSRSLFLLLSLRIGDRTQDSMHAETYNSPS